MQSTHPDDPIRQLRPHAGLIIPLCIRDDFSLVLDQLLQFGLELCGLFLDKLQCRRLGPVLGSGPPGGAQGKEDRQHRPPQLQAAAGGARQDAPVEAFDEGAVVAHQQPHHACEHGQGDKDAGGHQAGVVEIEGQAKQAATQQVAVMQDRIDQQQCHIATEAPAQQMPVTQEQVSRPGREQREGDVHQRLGKGIA